MAQTRPTTEREPPSHPLSYLQKLPEPSWPRKMLPGPRACLGSDTRTQQAGEHGSAGCGRGVRVLGVPLGHQRPSPQQSGQGRLATGSWTGETAQVRKKSKSATGHRYPVPGPGLWTQRVHLRLAHRPCHFAHLRALGSVQVGGRQPRRDRRAEG